MTKYTAADFANAKFAEHENGRTAMKSSGCTRWDVKFLEGHVSTRDDFHMASFGWVPVTTKPTITESAFEDIKTGWGKIASQAWLRGFTRAGGEIVPDPEPTNTERLEQLIRESGLTISDNGIEGYAAELAASLNEDGVTAPNVKGN